MFSLAPLGRSSRRCASSIASSTLVWVPVLKRRTCACSCHVKKAASSVPASASEPLHRAHCTPAEDQDHPRIQPVPDPAYIRHAPSQSEILTTTLRPWVFMPASTLSPKLPGRALGVPVPQTLLRNPTILSLFPLTLTLIRPPQDSATAGVLTRCHPPLTLHKEWLASDAACECLPSQITSS